MIEQLHVKTRIQEDNRTDFDRSGQTITGHGVKDSQSFGQTEDTLIPHCSTCSVYSITVPPLPPIHHTIGRQSDDGKMSGFWMKQILAIFANAQN